MMTANNHRFWFRCFAKNVMYTKCNEIREIDNGGIGRHIFLNCQILIILQNCSKYTSQRNSRQKINIISRPQATVRVLKLVFPAIKESHWKSDFRWSGYTKQIICCKTNSCQCVFVCSDSVSVTCNRWIGLQFYIL